MLKRQNSFREKPNQTKEEEEIKRNFEALPEFPQESSEELKPISLIKREAVNPYKPNSQKQQREKKSSSSSSLMSLTFSEDIITPSLVRKNAENFDLKRKNEE